MRQDQREFLTGEFEGLVEQFSTDLDREGCLGPHALQFVRSAERVLDWLRGDRESSPDLLRFLRQRLEEADKEMNYPEALKKVYEHDAFVAAIEALG